MGFIYVSHLEIITLIDSFLLIVIVATVIIYSICIAQKFKEKCTCVKKSMVNLGSDELTYPAVVLWHQSRSTASTVDWPVSVLSDFNTFSI